MNKSIVIDLDGTLTDLTHRLHHIKDKESKDWDAFFAACGDDAENKWCSFIMRGLSPEARIVIVSGRPERCRKATEQWLKDRQIPYHELYFARKDGDHAPDDLLKEQWLKAFGPENILFCIDDRQRVVDMWRRNGVVCLQCNAWEESE